MSKDKMPMTVTGEYLERLSDTHPDKDRFNSLFRRSDWPKKVKWWLGRVIDKLEAEAKLYFQERQDIINDNAKKWTQDGSFKSTAMGSVGQEITYRKGDIKTYENGPINWGGKQNEEKANDEFDDLRNGEITLPFWKITVEEDDIPDDLPPDEVKLLLPIIEVPEINEEFEINEKELEELKKKGDDSK